MLVDREKIRQAKEKLGDRNADIIAEVLKIEKWDQKNKKGCCPWHPEDTPSFIYNPKSYSMHCFGCARNTDILDAFMHTGMTYIEAVQKLFELANIPYTFGEVGVRTKHQYRYPKAEQTENKDKATSYLQLRKISDKTADWVDIRQDHHGNIVFNYYDTNDVLCMVKYRPSHKINKAKGEVKCWCQKEADTAPLLFNMNRINISEPLLITEGEMDCMAAIEAGYTNSVSVPFGANNYSWIEENFDWLEQFDSIIICADNDDPGIKMQKECVFRLGSWRTKFVEIPSFVIKEDKKYSTKDLNDILFHAGAKAVIELISNAKDSPVDSVSDFSDVTNIDLDEIDGIKTGIQELDQKLMKLFYGSFTIVTGVNGSGKSSFLSQLICNALDEEKNAFLYSGELPNFQSKNWINYIFAGQRNVRAYNFNGTPYWKVTQEAQREINTYYRGRLFIYKDGYSHKASSILKTMEDTTRKYGCKLHVIDNLTAVNLENSDQNKYQKQEEFITQLIDFAKKFNVAVVLVVHPHKIDMPRRLTKMDIQGISAIIDLAHRILSLYRVTSSDKTGIPKRNGDGWYKEPIRYDVICDILKDRMLGYEGSSTGLYYDKPSRRFFADEDSLDRRYKWDTAEARGPLPFPPPQLHDSDEIFGAEEQAH